MIALNLRGQAVRKVKGEGDGKINGHKVQIRPQYYQSVGVSLGVQLQSGDKRS